RISLDSGAPISGHFGNTCGRELCSESSMIRPSSARRSMLALTVPTSIASYGALKKFVHRRVGRYDPVRLAFGQCFPAAAYHSPSFVKYSSRHETRLFFLTNGVDSWHLFFLPWLPDCGAFQ